MISGIFGTFLNDAIETINDRLNNNQALEKNDSAVKDGENSSDKTSFKAIFDSYREENYTEESNKKSDTDTEAKKSSDNPNAPESSNKGNPSDNSSNEAKDNSDKSETRDDLVHLRPQAVRKGFHLEMDMKTEDIYIDGNRYTQEELHEMGAEKYSRSSWRVPEHIIPNPTGGTAPSDRSTYTIVDPDRKFNSENMNSEQAEARETYENTRYNFDVLSESQAQRRLEGAEPGSEEEKALENYLKAGQFRWDNPIYSTGDYTKGKTAEDREDRGYPAHEGSKLDKSV